MNKIFIVFLLVILTTVCIVGTTLCGDLPTRISFIGSIKSFPYQADIERKNNIILNISNLSYGMKKAEITLLFGKPDYCEPLYTKKISPEGKIWTYIIYLKNPHRACEKNDKIIDLFFSDSGVFQNIESFPSELINKREIKDTSQPKN